MIDGLWKLLCGYAIIQAEGMHLERWVNACRQAGIPLYRLQRENRLCCTAQVLLPQYRRACRLADKQQCTVQRIRTGGLGALVLSIWRRKIVWVGACLLAVLLLGAMQFVWQVRVTGVDGEQAQQALQAAQALGYRQGAWWKQIDLQQIERTLMKDPALGAVKILAHRKGLVLEIEIIPEEPSPQMVQPGEPCDIVASRDAVIVSVIPLEGLAEVEAGDVVQKGDVLIRGAYPRETMETRLVQARGTVMGKINITESVDVDLIYDWPEPTGREYTLRTLQICGWTTLLTGPLPFAESVVVQEKTEPLGGTVLPAKVTTQLHQEVNLIPRSRSYAEAEALGAEFAKQLCLKQLPEGVEPAGWVVQSQTTEGNQVRVTVQMQYIQEIGETAAPSTVVTPPPQEET